jgi:hypothetical protein
MDEIHIRHDVEAIEPQSLDELPPLPKQNLGTMRAQACTGCSVVLLMIGLLVGLPHMVRPNVGARFAEGGAIPVLLIILYAEAAVAIFCLCGLMFGDPGTLKRSADRCFPLPQPVIQRIRARQSLAGLENIHEGEKSFCVRCMIWRPDVLPPRYRDNTHHCSVCQRCVVDFDHHCGVRTGASERAPRTQSCRMPDCAVGCDL